MALLELRGTEVNYDGINTLKSISLKAEKGEIITLVGSNGAGKNTTVRTIMGLKESERGTITFDGEDITNKGTKVTVSRGIILSSEGRQVFPKFTVLDNLKLGAYLRPDTEMEESLETVYQLFPKLLARREQTAGTPSGGEQQMLAVGRTMMGKPRLLPPGEPSLGLAPLVIKETFEMILRVRGIGTAILPVEQNMRVALKYSDRAYMLETGRIMLEDTAENLLNLDEARRAYLGDV